MKECQSHKSSKMLPKVWLISDPRFKDRLYRSVQKLPKGSGVILRHYEDPNRYEIFKNLSRICRRRGLILINAGTDNFLNCHGRYYGKPPKNWLLNNRKAMAIISVHNARELAQARRHKADQLLISPLFATRSHKGERPLGVLAFRRLAEMSNIPVIAMGGMNSKRNAMIRYAYGYAAIDGLIA